MSTTPNLIQRGRTGHHIPGLKSSQLRFNVRSSNPWAASSVLKRKARSVEQRLYSPATLRWRLRRIEVEMTVDRGGDDGGWRWRGEGVGRVLKCEGVKGSETLRCTHRL
ncbi:hypothetical protein Tco_0336081 [Tanacetum coccineum]